MTQTLESTTAADEDVSFQYFERETDHPNGLSYRLRNFGERLADESQRAPNSIHGSGFWKCQKAFLMKVHGIPYSNYRYNWSNDQAAKAGEKIHEMIQEELVEDGLAVQVPVFLTGKAQDNAERWARMEELRKEGAMKPAIEVAYLDYYQKMSAEARAGYEGIGVNVAPDEMIDLIDYYRLGIRVDSVIRLPNYNGDIPCEIKTVKPEYWEGGKNYKLFGKKMLGYMYQLQMQMAFWRDSVTGKVPEWGMVYVVNRADTSLRIQRFVRYNPNFINMWLPRIRKIREAWDNGEILPGNVGDDCSFCEYYDACDEDDKPVYLPRMIEAAKAKKARRLAEEAA